ncbi:hypothetical protein X275_08645 [Marinitoga sp. 1197]|uniref:glycoside hydrolase family 38 N-terminal domain-containing protein n=1 Tax=Marinitoga sp. 1197 TaxID=1428449 RepID=UPI0006416AB0|nr:glycoside hydrolase family 38 C-terminal domain-containing protein [Marinitoga sp. 1197]KLO21597.1 hypothetical protein X275_08645 [Marinitoga sp. 1197]
MWSERKIRKYLGVPDDAEKVLIFTESSHWDPNWLYTSEKYFEKFVQKNLDLALNELEKEPRRVYSLENVFFLKMYWERNSKKRSIIRKFINDGRLRLMSSAVTSADTLLPKVEAILRDFFIGQKWLDENGLTKKTEVAYFPDSFGISPFLPSLLNAVGIKKTSITRVDGMFFPGCDFESRKNFPRKTSTAEILLRKERTLDFIWRDRNGKEVLTHWNAFTYGMGDMLAYIGISRVYLARFAFSLRKSWHVAYRIRQYIKALEPFSKTPYILCPIGYDFIEPIPDLVSLLDRYNKEYYQKTGIWTVLAGLDDYLLLVEFYKKNLPILEIDPNPYWTGFYFSRQEIKEKSYKLLEKLTLAEKLSVLKKKAKDINSDLQKAWWISVISNHHDFITGTSTDEVVEKEQISWLNESKKIVDNTLKKISLNLKYIKKERKTSFFNLSKKGVKILVENTYYKIEIDSKKGIFTYFAFNSTKDNLLKESSNSLALYRDSGGLWRMGYEFKGGIWKEKKKFHLHNIKTEITNHETGIEIVNLFNLNDSLITRRIWIDKWSSLIYFRTDGKLKKGYTLTSRFILNSHIKKLLMHSPGGVIERPYKKIYDPTFWPINEFVCLKTENYYMAVFKPYPGSISCDDEKMEITLLRSAEREKVFGFLGLPANPVSYKKQKVEKVEFAIMLFRDKINLKEKMVETLKHLSFPWQEYSQILNKVDDSLINVEPKSVLITAIKPTSTGDGIIVRFYAPFGVKEVLKITPNFEFKEAYLCNAKENDIEKLKVSDGTIYIKITGSIVTIKFI